MIYFVHGPDPLLVREHVNEILDQLDADRSNTTRIDGRSSKPGQIATMAGTPGFFGAGRIIVVDDLFAGKSRSKKNPAADEDGATTTTGVSDEILHVLESVAPSNRLILAEPSLSSLPAAVKKKALKLEVRAGTPPRGSALIDFVMLQAKNAGSTIDQRGAKTLLDLLSPGSWQQAPANPRYDVPPDLDAIQQEVRKLAAFAYPQAISHQHVRDMTPASTADQLFPFLSAMFGGDLGQALKLLAESQDGTDDLFRLVAQVMQQAELAVPLEAAMGRSPEGVGTDLAVSNPRRMIAIERSSRAQPVTPFHHAVVAADRDQKTGKLRTAEDVLIAILAATGKQKRAR